jgi:malonate-semialdehyde dehydrogenase (acetylating)/methylmalonate-semialdehyde dehydrogenase
MPHLLKGENLEGIATAVDVELVRQPVGVVAAITPFNFPAMIPPWFLPYALAAGNAFS